MGRSRQFLPRRRNLDDVANRPGHKPLRFRAQNEFGPVGFPAEERLIDAEELGRIRKNTLELADIDSHGSPLLLFEGAGCGDRQTAVLKTLLLRCFSMTR